jgi:hypothetical protein
MLAIMKTWQVAVRALALLAALGPWAGCSDDAGPGDDIDAAVPPDPRLGEMLGGIDGVVGVDELAPVGDRRRFELRFEQPVDHGDLAGPRFPQKVTLLHRGFAAPMVLVSTGYHDFLSPFQAEPTALLDANQIVIEHRYFGASRPAPVDWAFLDVAQAAADHHRVVAALRPLYTGAWISTGASKGGSVSVFHRRFYPDDVDGTVAYVAPISFAAGDPRYEGFFDQLDQALGDDDCVERVRAVQRRALLERVALEEHVTSVAASRGDTFERMGGLPRALETAVVELEWTFWQYMGLSACGLVPGAGATVDQVVDFVDVSGVISSVTDQQIEAFEPYFYQAATEMGYPGVPHEHLADLLQFDYEAASELLLPEGVDAPAHDPAPMQDVADWLAGEGERVLFVYGAHDPWTAGRFELGQARDSYLYVAATSHGATILDLAEADRQAAEETLARWAGVAGRPLAVRAVDRAALQRPSVRLRPRPGL